jgi:hypothetical protein
VEAAAYGAVLEAGRGFSRRAQTKVPRFTRDDKRRGGFNAFVETRARPRVGHALELFRRLPLAANSIESV